MVCTFDSSTAGFLASSLDWGAHVPEIWTPACADVMGHINALYDCNKHIRQYGASSPDSVGSDHGFVCPELACISCLSTSATSR